MIHLILAVMEIESWFLADYNVFSRIDPFLTIDKINESLDKNLRELNPESLRRPSTLVHKIFTIVGRSYKKREDQIYSIVNNLDYDYLISSDKVFKKVESFAIFINCLDNCLSATS